MPKIKKTIKPEKTPEVDSQDEVIEEESEQGDHNLFLLGLASVGIAVITTVVSLVLYHNSGDIYLDRSRPGFLPDEEEMSNNNDLKSTYTFPDSGALTEETLDEYLKNINEVIDALDNLESPFSSEPLSDKSLGIEDTKPAEKEHNI